MEKQFIRVHETKSSYPGALPRLICVKTGKNIPVKSLKSRTINSVHFVFGKRVPLDKQNYYLKLLNSNLSDSVQLSLLDLMR